MDYRTEIFRAMNGDNAAMEKLYKATYPKLRAITMSILKNEDDTEDVVQDTYVKAFSNLNQLGDPNKFDAWLCRIASNRCKDYLKKHKPLLFTDMSSGNEDEDPYEWSIEDESGHYNPEEIAITDDTRRQLMEIINTLPDEQRICLVCYAVEEMKIPEIARMMEVSESTVKSRLKYAKDKMKAKIEELEKKGVKIRSLSGFAVIPLVFYLFSTETKAATTASFTAVSEAVAAASKAKAFTQASNMAMQSGKNAAMRGGQNVAMHGAKNISAEVTKQAAIAGAKATTPLFVKIAAGVVAATVTVGGLVAVPKVVDRVENLLPDNTAATDTVAMPDVTSDTADTSNAQDATDTADTPDTQDKIQESGKKMGVCEGCGRETMCKTIHYWGESYECCSICTIIVKVLYVFSSIMNWFWEIILRQIM